LKKTKTRAQQLEKAEPVELNNNEANYKKDAVVHNVDTEKKIRITEILRKEAVFYER
jgi:hypothetical protein